MLKSYTKRNTHEIMKYNSRLIVYKSSVLDIIFYAHFTCGLQEGKT